MCDNLGNESSENFNYTHPFTGTQQNPLQENEAVKAPLKRLQNEWMTGEGGGEEKKRWSLFDCE